MSKKVVIATVKPFSPAARQQVEALLKKAGYETAAIESYEGPGPLHAAVADANALIVRSDKIDAEVIAAAKELKLVVRAGAGYDNVDCAAAKGAGVAVMNTPGQNSNAVAELVFGMMVYMARGQFNGKPGTELKGKTLGIHAVGFVGRAVATIAKGFGMNVIGFDPFVDADKMKASGVTPVSSVEDLYSKSDYVSLHIPATAETKGSIGKALLSRMPQGGVLINTARKEVINDAEMAEVLAERADLKYATDIAGDNDAELKEKFAGRYYSTPKKMGAQTLEANTNAGVAAANQIVAFFEKGDRTFVVND